MHSPQPRSYAFPQAAVARLSPYRAWPGDLPIPPSVQTAALAQAEEHLYGYLGQEVPAGWQALTIVGRLGMGKTHVARRLADALHRAEQRDQLRLVTVDSPDPGFHRSRVSSQLDRFDLYERIKDYYAGVVADTLVSAPGAEELVDGLRSGSLDPEKVVDHFGLVESTLHDTLHRLLGSVTELSRFSTALTLALIPRHEEDVWRWLTGGPPSAELAARGVTRLGEDTTTAFDVLGVLAHLYGRAGFRFVLIMDEFDKLLGGADHEREQRTLQATERLVNIMIESGGLFVFCASPQAQEIMPPSLLQRSRTVRLDPFSGEDLVTYIVQALGRQAALFPRDVADHVIELTGGVPRQAIELCAAVWSASARERPVTVPDVHEAIRRRQAGTSVESVTEAVRETLRAAGWRFVTGERGADFWLPLGHSGIAVLIEENLIQPDDLRAHRDRATELRNAELITVVRGFLSEALRDEVAAVAGRQPLAYGTPGFRDSLRELVQQAQVRLEAVAREGELGRIRRRLDELSRMHSYTQGFLEQMRSEAERASDLTGQRLAALDSAEPGSSGARPGVTKRLPDEVRRLFDAAIIAVARLADPGDPFEAAFEGAGGGPVQPPSLGRATMELVGAVELYGRLLESFATAVADWMESVRAAGGQPGFREHELLRLTCRTYSTLAERLPLLHLEAQARQAPFMPRLSPAEETMRRARRNEAVEALDDLGQRVRTAAEQIVLGAGGPA
ncbi:hypothetical protein [Nonomuraea sp. NPDC050783]|uniref:hypothetical protein n=1 Tax=Nonomuraea sp. NPDC050783 TaxID=3154634 RepID=UPI003464FC20